MGLLRVWGIFAFPLSLVPRKGGAHTVLSIVPSPSGSGFPPQQLAIRVLILNNLKTKQAAPTLDSAGIITETNYRIRERWQAELAELG